MGAKEFKTQLMELQPSLLNMAKVLTSNSEDAFDLLQDTTLKALDNQDKYQDNDNLKGWVLTLMRNIFINNYRRSCRVSMINVSDSSTSDHVFRESGIVAPEGSYTVKEINDAIGEFPEGFRVPFSMHLEGYKYSEIAHRTGLPMGTVKSRIYVARRRLQARFAEYL